MVLVLDVGNTNIKYGIFDGDVLKHSFRTHTDVNKTADDIGIIIMQFFGRFDLPIQSIEGIIVASVVPHMNYTLEHMCSIYFGISPIFVGPGIKTGLNILYDDPKELGADRIANAVAALNKYKKTCVIIDFGTATTFSCVSKKGEFLGGAIFPGFRIAMKALSLDAANLFSVELVRPKQAIGKNTKTCIQSGLLFGFCGAVDSIIEKMKKEIPDDDIQVVATGGAAQLILLESEHDFEIDHSLSLTGIKLLYDKNKSGGK